MSSCAKIPAAAFAVALSLFGAVPAARAVLEGWQQDATGSLWADGDVPLELQLDPPTPPVLLDGNSFNGAAKSAIEEWDGYVGRIHLVPRVASTAPILGGNGFNNVFFASSAYGQEFGTDTTAVTVVWHTGTKRTEADIILNSAVTWNSFRGVDSRAPTGAVDLRREILHQLGHFLGLTHPAQFDPNYQPLMIRTGGALEAVTAQERLGMIALYGAGPRTADITPVIVRDLPDKTVQQGSFFELGATPDVGLGLANPTWEKDGVPVPSLAGQSSLISLSAAPSEAGRYRVTYTSSAGSVVTRTATLTVVPAVPPSFTVPPATITVDEGTPGMPSYTLAGTGPFELTWTRDGVVLNPNHTGFWIDQAKLSDAGTYTLTATNVAGSVTSAPFEIRVVPGKLPVITRDLPALNLTVGDRIDFSPSVTSATSVAYQWYKDDVAITGATLPLYFVARTTKSHAGIYHFTATNVAGTTRSTPVRVRVEDPVAKKPVVVTGPNSIVARVGDSCAFDAAFAPDPTLKFQWYHDGVAIAGATSLRLTLTSLRESDAGKYTLTASNSEGAATTTEATLTVDPAFVGADRFLLHPASVELEAGDHLALTISYLAADGPKTLEWLKDGVVVPNAGVDGFYLYNVGVGVAGTYRARLTTARGVVLSDPAVVRVREAGETFWLTKQIGSRTAQEFTNVYLSVETKTVSAAPITAVWRRNGTVVPELGDAPSIGFLPLRQAHAGEYTCTLTQNGVNKTSGPFTLTVLPLAAPRFTDVPSLVSVSPGGSTTIAVGVDTPAVTPTFQWYRNGVPVAGANRGTLFLLNITAATPGIYVLRATNGVGTTDTPPIEVRLLDAAPGAPVFASQPTPVSVPAGAQLALQSFATGTPEPTYQWLRDGIAIAGATAMRYEVAAAAGADAGRYSVVATNTSGSALSETVAVTILPHPGAPRFTLNPPSRIVSPGTAVKLVARAEGDGAIALQWRRNGQPIPGATNAEFNIAAAVEADTAVYDVVATNALGSATSLPMSLTVGIDNGRIVALSARAQVGTGGDVLIPGFAVGGTVPKKLLIRALGPTLGKYGVSGALADPKLELRTLAGAVVAANNDWTAPDADPTLASVFKLVGAAPLDTGTKDAALLATLAPGLYTAVTSGADGGKGVALLEVFDVDPAAGKLTGISTRAVVGTGADVLIPGIVVEGTIPKKLLIRVSGPALTKYGVTGVLADPKLEIIALGGAVFATNDDWSRSDHELTAAATTIGLAAFADGSKDAALVATLPPGVYTIVISGADGGSGVALVEVYDVP